MKVVVLAGGISTERDVSLSSGRMIYQALQRKGHQVVFLDVFLGYHGDVNNIFNSTQDQTAEIEGVKENNPDIEQVKALRPDWQKNFFGPNVITICQEEILFLWHCMVKMVKMVKFRPALI